jgi:glycosyltransferase involved in cell wall biosynthesis
MMSKILPGLVSIVMPAFNGESFIRQAIDSVLSQTYSNWELIIVDDGSTDRTAEIIRRYGDDSRIWSVYQENKGQAAALNRGLELASGEFVTTLDTDDWYTPESLQLRVRYLNDHTEFGTVYGDGVYCDVNGNVLKRFSEYRIGDVTGDVYDALIAAPFFGTGANVMIRRELIEKFQLRYDETIFWCQDLDFYIRVAERCSFGIVDSITVWYRIHRMNMTMSAPEGRRLESLIRTKHKVLSSPRFERAGLPSKKTFFLNFLKSDLYGRLEDQEVVIRNKNFQSLLRKDQAEIMRLVANQYLFLGSNQKLAKDWLKRAWHLAPFDAKTLLSVMLVSLNPGLVKFVMGWRQRGKDHSVSNRSPFEFI